MLIWCGSSWKRYDGTATGNTSNLRQRREQLEAASATQNSMTVRRLTYLLIWGTTLLALLAKLSFLPSVLRFAMWALAVMVNAPGVVTLGKTLGFLYTRSPWGYLVSALLTCLWLEPVLRWLERPMRAPDLTPDQARQAVTRRSFLLGGAGLAGGSLLGGYGYWVERKNFHVQGYRLFLNSLPQGLEGLRLVVMADMHCGPVNRPDDLWPALQLANSLKPDLVLLPGDFVHLSARYFHEAAELIDRLETRIPGGILYSWGNHDHWNDLEAARRTFSQTRAHELVQQRRVLRPDRQWSDHGKGLWIAGVDDLWEGLPDLSQALHGIPLEQPRLVLCHNPDVAELQSARRVDLMLSGHTHGGQIRVPGLGTPICPSRYGQKYAGGFVQGPSYPVYITRGLGVGGIPVRLGVLPEVTFFELHPSQHGTQIQPMGLT